MKKHHIKLFIILLLLFFTSANSILYPDEKPKTEPKKGLEWVLVDKRLFTGRNNPSTYKPYYVIQAGNVGLYDKKEIIKWHHYEDEPEVEYRPDEEFLLDCSRVFDRWIRLTDNIPHTVKWKFEFQPIGGAFSIWIEPNGIILSKQPREHSIDIDPAKQHTVTMERTGTTFSVTIDNWPPQTKKITPDDRTPLRFTAQISPAVIRNSWLCFAQGEKLSPPPKSKEGAEQPPKWEINFAEDFNHKDSIKSFAGWPHEGTFGWKPESKALHMGPSDEGGDNMYVMFKKSLPGDVRIKFRARSTKPRQPAFFGLLLDVEGSLRKEDGYFAEWNYWQVQIKKKNVRKAGKAISYPRSIKANDWLNFMVERKGKTITMYTEKQKVLSWDDPYPYKDNKHDLFSFYIWRVPMEFDNIIIERNVNDTVKPRTDHPVFQENYIDGIRDAKPEPKPEEMKNPKKNIF